MQQKMKIAPAVLIVLISVICAALMTRFLTTDFSSIDIFAPVEKKVDFRVTDIYNEFAARLSVRPMNDEIVVVNIDSCNREGVMKIIQKVNSFGAKAIGLDVYFSIEKKENDTVLNTILPPDNLVNATQVKLANTKMSYDRDYLSFFEGKSTPKHVGFINMDADNMWTIIRTFHPYVTDSTGSLIPGLALALAEIAYPEKADILKARHNTQEIIDFTSQEIKVIGAHRLDNEGVPEDFNGKIVLIGDTTDAKDIYLTPLAEPTPGVLIHAYALQTILNESYITVRSDWFNWSIALIISLILVSILLFANESERLKYSLNILIRVLILVFMYVLVKIGCAVYANSHVYVDMMPSVLMLGFSTLAFDIIYAVYGLIRQIKQRN